MTRRYRENKHRVIQHEFSKQDILPICETFDKAAIENLISQPNCTGLRIYYSMDEQFKVHAVLVGVGLNNEDLIPDIQETNTMVATLMPEVDKPILDEALRCPPECPPISELNV